MTFSHGIRMGLAAMGLAVLFAGTTGCVVNNEEEQRMIMQQQREDSLLFQDEMRRLRARIDALESDIARLNQQVNTANQEQSRAVQSQLQGVNASLEELQKRIRTVDAARESDKKEIVDTLSKRITEVMSRQQAAARPAATARRPVSSEGYEHTVQTGETLSAIAKAYGARTADIIEANNLRSADMLRVGQKLFIPAP
ncbi:MAG TPA: LysM peptidoglycan-binding domain-containing protein [Kiritimatiellia bacterium]|nr:LysM peptidoglycan-binding domain-containing protein [Kiritimatiellia bacterium]HMO97499.1 LysM peptidoglycan-binding domain-containing protein [Kiritimatiellia bacterium]HMP96308.1 LysM peptidoglycan-binding domain-containing protein [Kiritimatiellia bacterium]